MKYDNEQFDGSSFGNGGNLKALDELTRASTSPEKLRSELLAQRLWFTERLGIKSQQASSSDPATMTANRKTLYAIAEKDLSYCIFNYNRLSLAVLSAFASRNKGEIQMHIWNEGDKDLGLTLRISNAVDVEMMFGFLYAVMEFKARRRCEGAVEAARLDQTFGILTHAGANRVTLQHLVQAATYLGFRLRIAVVRS